MYFLKVTDVGTRKVLARETYILLFINRAGMMRIQKRELTHFYYPFVLFPLLIWKWGHTLIGGFSFKGGVESKCIQVSTR